MHVLTAAEHLEAAHADRRDERFRYARSFGGCLEIGQVAAECSLSAVAQRADAGRTRGDARHQRATGIELRKLAHLPAPAHDAHRLSRRRLIRRRSTRRRWPETRDATEYVHPPGGKIRGG